MVAYGKLSRLWSACSNIVRIPTSLTDYTEWVANISHCQWPKENGRVRKVRIFDEMVGEKQEGEKLRIMVRRVERIIKRDFSHFPFISLDDMYIEET
jgi:disulfide oxidoreductase YuzD